MTNDELINEDKEFSEYSAENGVVKAFEQYLADNATLLPNNGNPIVGKDEILKFLAAPGEYEMVWTPEAGLLSEKGDLGYTWGNWTMTVKDKDGKVISSENGKYSDCWIKQEGKWKVLFDMSNMNPSTEAK